MDLVDPTNPSSLAGRARARRWRMFNECFPDLSDMTVLDLGGTPGGWSNAPVTPKHIVFVNLNRSTLSEDYSCEHFRDDVTEPTRSFESYGADLVYSNSVIEHLGGHYKASAFASLIDRTCLPYWVQTPYKYFPVEPHWVTPGFQLLPTPVAVQLARRLPYPSSRKALRDRCQTQDSATEAVLSTRLLNLSELRHYFPKAEILCERFLGIRKSIIAWTDHS